MSSESKRPAVQEIAAAIRKEIGRDANARFLRGLDTFAADEELPERFRFLLARLDRAEARSR